MRKVLIVSPSFPPVVSADLHRVRMSLPHFESFGWNPHVLALEPAAHGGLIEPELLATIPDRTPITRTGALPERLTRLFGIGNPGIRALSHLYAAGSRLIRRESIDLVYFSTTHFPVMTLGRLWKLRHGVPYVIDLQDPWKTEDDGVKSAPGVKTRAARRMHAVLEPFAMARVDGVVSVSDAYLQTLYRRYSALSADNCAVIPFGASEADVEVSRRQNWANPFFRTDRATINAVSVGRGGHDLRYAADLLFTAVRLIQDRGVPMRPVRFWFAGTDYASRNEATISPVAERAGIGPVVTESPNRLPYLQALRLLQDASVTVMLGSDEGAYSPSKVYPYLLAGKPFIAVMHEASSVNPLLERAGTGLVVKFAPGQDVVRAAADLADRLGRFLITLPEQAPAPRDVIASVAAREMTKRQCLVFDQAIGRQATRGVPCAG